MKVRDICQVSLALTTFDDGCRWVHVDRRGKGMGARTLFQSKAELQLSNDELDMALIALDGAANTMVNSFRRNQTALF